MNKKFLTFGLIGLFALALVSAGLVNYLSNTEEIDMDILSPIAIDPFNGDVSPAYGGEVQTISTSLTNLADAQIKGKIQIVITNDGITLGDFNTLTASIIEYVDMVEVYSAEDVDMTTEGGFIESISEAEGSVTITTTERTFEILETWDADIALGFKSNAEGNYNVAVTIVPLA